MSNPEAPNTGDSLPVAPLRPYVLLSIALLLLAFPLYFLLVSNEGREEEPLLSLPPMDVKTRLVGKLHSGAEGEQTPLCQMELDGSYYNQPILEIDGGQFPIQATRDNIHWTTRPSGPPLRDEAEAMWIDTSKGAAPKEVSSVCIEEGEVIVVEGCASEGVLRACYQSKITITPNARTLHEPTPKALLARLWGLLSLVFVPFIGLILLAQASNAAARILPSLKEWSRPGNQQKILFALFALMLVGLPVAFSYGAAPMMVVFAIGIWSNLLVSLWYNLGLVKAALSSSSEERRVATLTQWSKLLRTCIIATLLFGAINLVLFFSLRIP